MQSEEALRLFPCSASIASQLKSFKQLCSFLSQVEWFKQPSGCWLWTVLQKTPLFILHYSLPLSHSVASFRSYPESRGVSELVLVMESRLLILPLRKILLLVQSVSTSHTLTAHKFLSCNIWKYIKFNATSWLGLNFNTEPYNYSANYFTEVQQELEAYGKRHECNTVQGGLKHHLHMFWRS